MNIFKEFIIYLAQRFQEPPMSKEVEELRRQLKEANGLYYSVAEENTKLRNKLSSLSFKNTWYERDHYPIPLNKKLLVQAKDGRYLIGVAQRDSSGRTVFNISYELTTVHPNFNDSVIMEFHGLSSWAKQWKVFEFPEDDVPEPKKSTEDCKIGAR